MVTDLQKAGIWKRIAAWMFDGIFICLLAVGFGVLLSGLLGYDTHSQNLDAAYARYEAEFGTSFDITYEDYQTLTPEKQKSYDDAYEALIADEEAMYAYNMMLSLSMVIIAFGILIAYLVWEFFMPLAFRNGQTLGKRIFSLCLIRNDGVQVNNLQLFTRVLLGKYTIETMIPVAILMMLFWGIIDVTGTLVLLALLIAQVVCLVKSKTNSAIHDMLAGTVVVDQSSQLIFHSTEDLIAYQKQVAAERAARQTY